MQLSPPAEKPDSPPLEQAAGPPRRRILRLLFNVIRNGLAVIGLIFILYHTCFQLSVVSSGSMAPTLRGEGRPGSDWLLSESISLWFRKPRRWEVVQFYTSDHLLVAKRIVALPGESVSLQDKRVAINGELAPCPSSLASQRYLPYGQLRRGQAASCDAGYFVLGDDTKDSVDSRYEGPVTPDRICGRAWLIVWPPARMGFVNP